MTLSGAKSVLLSESEVPLLRAHRGVIQKFQLSPWPILELEDKESGWVQRLGANNQGVL